MIKKLLIACLALASFDAVAEDVWVYEFEFGIKIDQASARPIRTTCDALVPPFQAEFYVIEPRAGFQVSCGGNNPVYLHFLGRKCGRPLRKLQLECGWRHLSHAFDGSEIDMNALSVRGRFTW